MKKKQKKQQEDTNHASKSQDDHQKAEANKTIKSISKVKTQQMTQKQENPAYKTRPEA